jgi:hypothetical protein
VSKALALEALAVSLLAAMLAAALPLSTGSLTWSWDALNHHIYLGMTAQTPRWDLDVNAASLQSYQYPYPYWPVYRLSLLTGSGAVVGAVWSAFQAAMVALPVWLVSLRLVPAAGSAWESRAQRLLACSLAFANAIVLIGLETTANDVLAAVPLLWGVAVALGPMTDRRAFMAAAFWGVSAAFKLSNGLFLPLLLFWWWQAEKPWLPWRRGLALALGAAAGFGVLYAPWGWQLWQLTGNPVYPFLGSLFGTG